jgi:hypothetical protein
MASLPPRKVITGQSAVDSGATFVIDTLGNPFITLYVRTGAGVSGGVVALESSPDGDISASSKWTATPEASITTNAASTTFSTSISEGHRYLRARISTIITGGTIDAWIAAVGGGESVGWA